MREPAVTKPGKGTGTTSETAPPGSAEPTAAAARVLVVEDEPPIARIARRILEGAGYAVAIEPDGRSALARLRGGDRFDVVLTDAAMPAMSGWQLANEISRFVPPTPVVLMSGYAEHSAAGRPAGSAEPAEFLQKPFTNVELLAVIRRALGR
jgi:two-component system, cell cycle sensor histidine kinase and response regulator CckA